MQIAQIAAAQHGNITSEQLRTIGIGRGAIESAIRTGRLHRVYRGVYAVGRPPSTPVERAAAALLACGPRAALSHGSAMTLWGFWKRWDEPFEVTLAADRRPTAVQIYRCSTLLRRDVRVRDGIRVTSAARTALDMAPRMRPKSRNRLINDARRASLLSLEALADVVCRNATHPGARLLKPHLENPHNPTRSGGEDELLGFCARYELPTPQINADVFGFEVDAYFAAEKVIVEFDGWDFHSDRLAFETDRDRDATMLLHGIVTIRITWARLRDDPDREAARLHRILEDRRRQLYG